VIEWVTIGPHRLACGDALEALSELPDGSASALVTDPPYCSGSVSEAHRTAAKGQGLRSETIRRLGWFVGDNMGTAGLCFLLRSVAAEAASVVDETGSMLFFCDWRMQSALQTAIESAGVRYQGLVVWDKEHMGLGRGFRAQHELVLHFTNGSPEYADLGTGNVIRCQRVRKDDREHQTQKPVWLMRRLIAVVAPVGGVVIDPFMGSGTTALACEQTGRRFIGIERSREHFDSACRRIESALHAEPLLEGCA
jgi:site-specific DNA-methyltransferase (adenine-specific)